MATSITNTLMERKGKVPPKGVRDKQPSQVSSTKKRSTMKGMIITMVRKENSSHYTKNERETITQY